MTYTIKVELNKDPGYKTWTVILSYGSRGQRTEADFNENNLRKALLQMVDAIEETEHL